ncbi:hypothetical protein FHS31_000880 [Sphingomonas vulcanisoli]|uniref:Uncharacterized protein n=1 Tax=Sphingomonas vulcanisoli TaxID=1658060 RepID=A0ABX0TP21_9SPHN|nr:DUF6628 family protein [Sphingomonas vulcanisoli]NIJ07284.1 hypothetical protein [Sphingomonas vulcanisoli]
MLIPPSARLVADAPDCPYPRLALFAVRRMAAGGIGDAFAAQAFISAFGVDFRRPLLLMRTFMTEMARISARTIAVAPCCCPRITAAENAILTAFGLAINDPSEADVLLAHLLGTVSCPSVTETARTVAASFADCGMPLTEAC